MVVPDLFSFNSANLICQGTDESLGFRENESRLQFIHVKGVQLYKRRENKKGYRKVKKKKKKKTIHMLYVHNKCM